MKHRTLLLFCMLLCLVFPTETLAVSFNIDGINYVSYDGKTASVTYVIGKQYSGDVVIPENFIYQGVTYTVTSIGEHAFNNDINLSSVEMPNSISSIGRNAFSGSAISSIIIPCGVMEIGENAFSDCVSLKSIEMCTTNAHIDYTAFSGCVNLKSLAWNATYMYDFSKWFSDSPVESFVLGDKVVSVVENAFDAWPNLISIVVDVNNTIFDSRDDCNAIIESSSNTLKMGCQNTVIPNSITSIGNKAFSNCSGLTSIEIPKSIKSIGSEAFSGCRSLKQIRWNSENCESLPSKGVFYDCPIESFVFGGSVRSIPSYCCSKISTLTSVEIPNGVVSIGNSAFNGCSKITSILIPSSIMSIGVDAFGQCFGVESLVVDRDNTIYDSRDDCNAVIETKSNTIISGCKNTVIPESITVIGENAFGGCTGMTHVELPNSLISIGRGAFSGCTGLDNIIFHNSLESIGEYAFIGCTGITRVELPNSLISIGGFAFEGCTGLDNIIFPNNLESIGMYAFRGCTGMIHVELPKGVKNIGISAFSGCKSLKSVIWNIINCEYDENLSYVFFDDCPIESFVFGEEVQFIPPLCCHMLSNLTTIEIPTSVKRIGRYAFAFCAELKSVKWNAVSCNSIAEKAFDGCSIDSVVFGDLVQYIPDYCCDNLRGLTSITIPRSVTSISEMAFNGCTGLKSVRWNAVKCSSISSKTFTYCPIESFVFGEDVQVIPANCFVGMTHLPSIEIPNSVTSIGRSAFYGVGSLSSLEIPQNVVSV